MHFCIREASDLFARYLTLWHFRPCCAVADSVKCVCDFSENTGILDRRGHLPFGAVGDSLYPFQPYKTPASFFSLSTSSATLLTLMPALRPPGSSVFKTFSRGFMSALKSAAVFSSSGFFLAFMMLGSEA